MDTRKLAEKNLLFLTLTGSHAYGTNTPTSDKDYRGVFFAPKDHIISPFFTVEQVEQFRNEKDSTVFELKKYIKLLADQNPNIMELLWVEPRFLQHITDEWQYLWLNREVFLSKKAKHTFSGYAMSQLHRIKGHNKWINNPQPTRRPKEIDFVTVVWNATENKEWNKAPPLKDFYAYPLGSHVYGLEPETGGKWIDVHEAIDPIKEANLANKKFSLIVKFNQQLYKEHVENWQHYWTWKKERNETRSALEEKYGYDTKHAAHLIRLLRMGVEILRGDGVRVFRPDAEELLAIRNGKFTYDQIITTANELNKELDSVYETSKLPHSVDVHKASNIVLDIYDMCWDPLV